MKNVLTLRRARLFAPAVVIILVLAGGWTIQGRLAADRAGEWIPVTVEDLVIGIEVRGTLQAVESEKLGPPQVRNTWNFKIAMMAPEGSDANKGQPVLGFDTTDLAQKLDVKRAERESAAKQIEKTRADLVLKKEENELRLGEAESRLRKAELKLEAPADVMSAKERKEIEVDRALALKQVEHLRERLTLLERSARAEIRASETKRDEAERQVRELEESIRKMMITAPRDGTVIYVSDHNDQKKKVGDSAWRMEKVLEIPDLTKMIGEGMVDEADAGRVRPGQRVSLLLDAHPGVEFPGTIIELGKTVRRESDRNPLKVLEVTIELDKTDTERMRPGMRFRGTIELERLAGSPVIPREAVFVRDGAPVVYRKGVFSMKPVAIELGKRNDESVQVLRGLEGGDRILVRRAVEEVKS